MNSASFRKFSLTQFGFKTKSEFEENRIQDYLNRVISSGITDLIIRENQLSLDDLGILTFHIKQLLGDKISSISIGVNFEFSPDEYLLKKEFDSIGVHLKSNSKYKPSQFGVNIRMGKSCHNLDEVLSAESLGFDYVFISPIFPTLSHPEHKGLGLNYLEDIRKLTKIELIALGGIEPRHWDSCKKAGVDGIAGISWIGGKA